MWLKRSTPLAASAFINLYVTKPTTGGSTRTAIRKRSVIVSTGAASHFATKSLLAATNITR